MRKRVREVQKERLALLVPDELHSLLRVALRQGGLNGRAFDDFAITNQRHIPAVGGRRRRPRRSLWQTGASIHVVRVRQSEAVFETLIQRARSLMNPQVPFADVRRRITVRPERLGNRDFLRRQSPLRVRKQHAAVAAHAAANRITTGQKRRAARRANLSRRIEIGEAQSLRRHAIEVRRANRRRPVAT